MKNTSDEQSIDISLGYWLHENLMAEEKSFDALCESLQQQGYSESKARNLIMKQLLYKKDFGVTIDSEIKKLVGFSETSILIKNGQRLGTIQDILNLVEPQKKR